MREIREAMEALEAKGTPTESGDGGSNLETSAAKRAEDEVDPTNKATPKKRVRSVIHDVDSGPAPTPGEETSPLLMNQR